MLHPYFSTCLISVVYVLTFEVHENFLDLMVLLQLYINEPVCCLISPCYLLFNVIARGNYLFEILKTLSFSKVTCDYCDVLSYPLLYILTLFEHVFSSVLIDQLLAAHCLFFCFDKAKSFVMVGMVFSRRSVSSSYASGSFGAFTVMSTVPICAVLSTFFGIIKRGVIMPFLVSGHCLLQIILIFGCPFVLSIYIFNTHIKQVSQLFLEFSSAIAFNSRSLLMLSYGVESR